MARVTEIYACFEAFYAGFLELKSKLVEGDIGADVASKNDAINIDSLHQTFQLVIKNAFDREAFSSELKNELYYAVACFIDDDLIRMKWKGQAQWEQFPLEVALFESSQGGEEIFQRIHALLQKNQSIYTRQLAQVYFLILSLGFRGKYVFDEDFSMQHLKQQLYALLDDNILESSGITSKLLIAQPYQYTEILTQFQKLPTLRYWLNILGAIVILYFVFSYGAWLLMTYDINAEMEGLQQTLSKASTLWGNS